MSQQVGAAVTALVLVGVACSGGGAASPASSIRSGPAIIALKAHGIAMLPTDRFALPTFDYPRFKALLGQLAASGVPVVVNIWASWCGPCRVESPNLDRAATQYGTQVQFLGVDILDQRGAARDFIQEEGYPYPSVFDSTGDIRDGLGFIGQPDTIFFDGTGRRVDVWSGAIGFSELVARIKKILPA